MFEDPIVAEVREIREDLARQMDFDVAKIFADLRSRQASLGSRLVKRVTRPRPAPNAAGRAHQQQP